MKETCHMKHGDLARFFFGLFELVVRAVDVGAPGVAIQCFQESFYGCIYMWVRGGGMAVACLISFRCYSFL